MDTDYRWRAGRPGTVSHGRSKRWWLAGIAINAIILLGVWFHAKGATVTLEANLPDADFLVGQSRANQTGRAVFANIPYGIHPVTVERHFYKPFRTTIRVGWFGRHYTRAELEPLPVELVVQTLPGAAVLIDGNAAGRAAADGVFRKTDASLGRHTITVTLAGYHEWTETKELAPPRAAFYVGLRMTSERAQELQRQRERIYVLISDAQQLYSARQYKEAIALLDEALLLQPDHEGARQFRDRIQQTMQILNIR